MHHERLYTIGIQEKEKQNYRSQQNEVIEAEKVSQVSKSCPHL